MRESKMLNKKNLDEKTLLTPILVHKTQNKIPKKSSKIFFFQKFLNFRKYILNKQTQTDNPEFGPKRESFIL